MITDKCRFWSFIVEGSVEKTFASQEWSIKLRTYKRLIEDLIGLELITK